MLEAKRAALEDEPEDENQIKIDDIIESIEVADEKEALAPAEETATDDDNNETEKQDLTDEEDTGN